MRSVGSYRIGVLALLGLLVATPAWGQPNLADPPAFPAETLVPNENARALFEALQSNILTGDIMDQMPAEEARPVDQMIEQVLARGEQAPNWQGSGVDMRAIAGAREGGLAGNIAAGASRFGPNLVYYLDQPIEQFVPAGLVLVARRGEPVAGETVQVEIEHVSPKVVLAERVAYRREGNAYCRIRAESRLYADPGVPASEADMVAVVMTMRFLPALDRASLCQVAVERGPSQYVIRAFDTEGYRLPALDAAAAAFRIVPRISPTSPR